MMAQWEACKLNAPSALLFFRLGDFYEAFHDDAKCISKELNLTLTSRQGVPMCGVPFHAADTYLDKLVAKGHKVAIAEQMEDPRTTKGLVKRAIVRVLSPGTIIQSSLLEGKKNNYIAALAQVGSLFAVATLDVTTGEFRAFETELKAALLDELCRFHPVELLCTRAFRTSHSPFFQELAQTSLCVVNEGADVLFSSQHAHAALNALNFHLVAKPAAMSAAGALLSYLQHEMNVPLSHVTTLALEETKTHLNIDHSSLRNLELTQSHTESQTLLHVLDKTATPMGARLLNAWIKSPLLHIPSIERRQDAIANFLAVGNLNELHEHLEEVRDIERLIMKVSASYATPRDLRALGGSLSQIEPIRNQMSRFQAELLVEQSAQLTDPISQLLIGALSDTPPLRIGEGAIFKDGYNAELDRLRRLSKDSISWIAHYQSRLREETGIKTLKVGYTQAFGYYIEVTHAQSDKIPASFQRRQTLVSTERFITPELKEFEHQVLTAEERSKALETELFEELRARTCLHAGPIQRSAQSLATLDALLSLALVANESRWTRPKVDTSNDLDIQDGRHPMVERAIGRASFIPNDTALHSQERLMLITGPNMAGKSTYIRQVALIVVLAQMGSFVPATSARIGIVDQIFSRIGASDNLARGQSTFMVEMSETAHILHNATDRSLVLLDEIGRGTSTYDGISIAWAVADYLLTTLKSKTLFATHYWELTKLEQLEKGAVNYQVAVQEAADGIVFLRKILRGGTDKSYGVHVAKLAGLPEKVVKKAEAMLRSLEAKYPRGKAKVAATDEQLLFF